jgi:hypothetical protein
MRAHPLVAALGMATRRWRHCVCLLGLQLWLCRCAGCCCWRLPALLAGYPPTSASGSNTRRRGRRKQQRQQRLRSRTAARGGGGIGADCSGHALPAGAGQGRVPHLMDAAAAATAATAKSGTALRGSTAQASAEPQPGAGDGRGSGRRAAAAQTGRASEGTRSALLLRARATTATHKQRQAASAQPAAIRIRMASTHARCGMTRLSITMRRRGRRESKKGSACLKVGRRDGHMSSLHVSAAAAREYRGGSQHQALLCDDAADAVRGANKTWGRGAQATCRPARCELPERRPRAALSMARSLLVLLSTILLRAAESRRSVAERRCCL